MRPPLVSVIIPSFNCHSTIGETLRSICSQSWSNLEVIIVDDGSTDGTRLQISRSILDTRVKLVLQDNRGASSARNRGIAESQGDYIQFLDADDLLSENKIALQLRSLEFRTDAVSSCTWGRFVDDPSQCRIVEEPVWSVRNPVSWLIRSMLGDGMMHSGGWLVPREIIVAAGEWNESLSLHDDGEYFARVLLASRENIFVGDAVAYYRTHQRGISSSRNRKAAESALLATELKASALLKNTQNAEALRAIYTEYAAVAYQFGTQFPEIALTALSEMKETGSCAQVPIGGRTFRLVASLLGVENAIRMRMQIHRILDRLRRS